jgi:uncharacterized membrane protein YdjX (TVP38/TMEM64 family)
LSQPADDPSRDGGASAGAETPARPAWRRYAPLAIVAILAALVPLTGLHRELSVETLFRHSAALDRFVAGHGPMAVAAFVALYVAVVSLSIPGAVYLTMAGGFLFGGVSGALASILGATLGATVLFLIARSAFGDALVRRAGARAGRLAEGFREDAFNYLLFLRLVPVFPFFVVNLVAAVAGVRLLPFVLATAIGIVPATTVFAFVGAGLDSVLAAQEAGHRACLAAGRADCRLDFSLGSVLTPQVVAALVGLGLLALLPVAVRRWRARRGGERQD